MCSGKNGDLPFKSKGILSLNQATIANYVPIASGTYD